MHDISFLHDIIILLMASLLIVVVFKELGLSPALGYVVAGAAIGPFGFGFVTSIGTTKSVAELGIVFMLFAIGLELTFARLVAMKKYVFGLGGLQVIITSIAIFTVCRFILKLPSETSIVIGAALAMSSTAVVVQLIQERSEQATKVGRLSFAILLMQDLAVIPILVLLPILSKSENAISLALISAFYKAVIAMAIIFAIGRLLLRPLYKLIAKSHNDILFLSLTLLVVLGSAYITQHLGMSSALGAFIAGLMVAETEYRYRVEEEILTLKSLLLGLFFMSIGMSFDYQFLINSLPYIAIASFSLILLKTTIIFLLCKLFRSSTANSLQTGLLLSQGGEFAFIVFLIAVQQKFINHNLSEFLMTTTTFTMALTPLLASLGIKLKNKININETIKHNKIKRELGDISKHIVIIGFSKTGRIVSHILRKKNINYLVLDNNPAIVKLEKSKGYNIYYGDALNLDILNHICIDKCESVVIAMDDEIARIKITRFLRKNFTDINIITKADSLNKAERLKKVGATSVVAKNLETALQLTSLAMVSAGIDIEDINSTMSHLRELSSDTI